jgi:uncharacterized protein (TIGR00251 family)
MNDYIEKLRLELAQKDPFYIKVKVQSKAPRTEIVGQLDDGVYKVKVAAQPVRGQANAELLRFFKKSLNASEATIVSGGRDKMKLIRISR